MECKLVVVAVVKDGDRVLLGQKPPGQGPYPDTWHIPGGAVRLGKETCEEALQREVREETGLEVKGLERICWDTDIEPDKHGKETYYIFLQYSCQPAGRRMQPGDDLASLRWVETERLSETALNRPTRRLFKRLGYIR